jgi:HEAT repeat protein
MTKAQPNKGQAMEEKLILEMLESPYVETRLLATEFLLKAANPSLAAIVRAMEDEALLVRDQAVLLASRHMLPERLIGLVGNHGNAILRNSAIEALKKTKEEGRKALMDALSHPDQEVVMFAVQILGDLTVQIEAPPLLALVSHSDPNVSQAAIETLGKHKCREAVPRLLDVLTCEFWLQFAAITALGEIGDKRAVPKLLLLIEDEFCQMEALEALGKIGDAETIEPLVSNWQRTEWLPLRDRLTLSIARICQEEPTVKLGQILAPYLKTRELRANAEHYLKDALGPLPTEEMNSLPALELRKAAVYWLVRLPEPPALRLLVEHLQSQELESSLHDAFAFLGAAALPALRVGLTSGIPAVRRKSARLLGSLGAREALSDLVLLLQDSYSDVKLAAIEALGILEDPAASHPLLLLLSSPESELRDAAAQALSRLPQKALSTALLSYLEQGNDLGWISAFEVISTMPDAAFVPFIRKGLASTDPVLVRAAVRAASKNPAFDLLREIGPLLEHDSPVVRIQAIDALGMSTHADAPALLFTRLKGAESERYFVIRALGDLRASSAVSLLLSLFDSFDPRTRLAALEALGKIGGREAEAFLLNCLDRAFGEERRAAAAALAACNTSNFEERFIALSQEPDWRLRIIAAYALGNSQSEASSLALKSLSRDTESVVARAARSALAQPGQNPKGPLR